MDKKLDNMLFVLDDEIAKKCYEIKKKKVEKKLTEFFVLTCILFLTVPVLLVFAGVNLLSICTPVILFLVFGMFALSPIVLNNNLGGVTR